MSTEPAPAEIRIVVPGVGCLVVPGRWEGDADRGDPEALRQEPDQGAQRLVGGAPASDGQAAVVVAADGGVPPVADRDDHHDQPVVHEATSHPDRFPDRDSLIRHLLTLPGWDRARVVEFFELPDDEALWERIVSPEPR